LSIKNSVKQVVIGIVVFFSAIKITFAVEHHSHSKHVHKHIHHAVLKNRTSHHEQTLRHKRHHVVYHSHHHHSTLKKNNVNEEQNITNNNLADDLNTNMPLKETKSDINLPVPSVFQGSNSAQTSEGQFNNINMEDNTSLDTESPSPSPPETTRQRLVSLVNRAIGVLHHTSYRFGGGYFDLSRGIYEEDCSGYVDQLLNRAEPEAYAALTQWTHSSKPSSFDYYDFFRKLPDQSWHFWQKIKDVGRLKPGAILVFRYHGRSRFGAGGHVMVVMSQPIPVENHDDTFLVRVSDSANSGHSDDTRAQHTSGVGIGTLLLKVNPFTREPNAYAWKLSGWLEHVDVAMAQPVTPA